MTSSLVIIVKSDTFLVVITLPPSPPTPLVTPLRLKRVFVHPTQWSWQHVSYPMTCNSEVPVTRTSLATWHNMFHTRGPATVKDLSHGRVLLHGTTCFTSEAQQQWRTCHTDESCYMAQHVSHPRTSNSEGPVTRTSLATWHNMFHIRGPATVKDLSHGRVLLHGTTHLNVSVETQVF